MRNLRPVLVGAKGAVGPMLGALSKALHLAGRGLIVVSERLEEVSKQAKAKHATGEKMMGTSGGLEESVVSNSDVWWTNSHEPEVIEL